MVLMNICTESWEPVPLLVSHFRAGEWVGDLWRTAECGSVVVKSFCFICHP